MDESATRTGGVIDGASHVLAELLRSPRFKQSLRIVLNELDPENAPRLVSTLWEEDPEVFLGLLSSLPAVTNAVIEMAREILAHGSEFPPALLRSFAAELFQGVRADRLGEAAGLLVVLAVRMGDRSDPALAEATGDFGRRLAAGFTASLSSAGIDGAQFAEGFISSILKAAGALAARAGSEAAKEGTATAKAVDTLAAGIRDLARENPEFIKSVAGPLARAVGEALSETSANEAEGTGDA